MMAIMMEGELREKNTETTTFDQESDDACDTLSFCDLPIYGGDGQSSAGTGDSFSDQDFFEFFSDDWASSTDSSFDKKPENIVFCGKVIPYKNPVIGGDVHDDESEKDNAKNEKKGIFRRWKSKFREGKNDFPVKKLSILASPSKSRWYLFVFGLSSYKFPAEMDLIDIRSRLSRRTPSEISPAMGSQKAVGVGGSKWWRLVSFLGCGGGFHRNGMVTTSFRL